MRVNLIGFKFLKADGINSVRNNMSAALKNIGVEIVRNSISSNFDIVDLHAIDPLSAMLVLNSVIHKKPVVIHAHSLYGDVSSTFNLTEKLGFLLNPYFAGLYRQADVIIALTNFSRKKLLELGLSDKPIYVISNGIDTEKFRHDPVRRKSFRRRLGLDEKKVIVYTVGNVVLRKGIVTFANMARKFSECEFMWAGPKYPKVLAGQKELLDIQETAPKNLHFLGYVKDIRDVHCGGDIFLFPSNYETGSLAVLEAASCSQPLVFRNLEVYDRFRHGKECFKCNNDREFEKAIEKLAASKKLRHRMGMLARKNVLDVDIKIVARKTLKVYESAIELKRKH